MMARQRALPILGWLACVLAFAPSTRVCGWKGPWTLAAGVVSGGDHHLESTGEVSEAPTPPTVSLVLVRGGFWKFGRKKKQPLAAPRPLLPEYEEGSPSSPPQQPSPQPYTPVVGGGVLSTVEGCLGVLAENPKPKVALEALSSLRALLCLDTQDANNRVDKQIDAKGRLKDEEEAAAVVARLCTLLHSHPRDRDVMVALLEAMRGLVEGRFGEVGAALVEEEGGFRDLLWPLYLGGVAPLWRDLATREAGVGLVQALVSRRPELAMELLERRVEVGVDAFLHPLLRPARPLPVGLQNYGATCYLNSVLQQLYNTPTLRETLLPPAKTTPVDAPAAAPPAEEAVQGYGNGVPPTSVGSFEGGGDLAQGLASVFRGLAARRAGAHDPRPLIKAAAELPLTYEVLDQNDASELFMMLVEALKGEMDRGKGEERRYGGAGVFDGRMVNRYACESCGAERSAREEASVMVQLNLRGNLMASLTEMVQGTRLDDMQACKSCGAKTVMRSQQFLGPVLPQTLVFQLGRFQPGPGGYGSVIKVLDRFEFPQEMDVGPFTWAEFKKQQRAAQAADRAAQAAKQAALDAADKARREEEEEKEEEEKKKRELAEAVAGGGGGGGDSTAADDVTVVVGGGGGDKEDDVVVVVGGGEAEKSAPSRQGGPQDGPQDRPQDGPQGAPPAAVVETVEALVQELEDQGPFEGGEGCRYRLTGVVIHQGSSPHLGHYYSYVLCPEEARWYCANDASVTPFSLEDVEKVWFQGGHASPFLLFYERVEEEGEEAGRGEEEGQAVVVPSMGLQSVALVVDLMRHLTLTALSTSKGGEEMEGRRRRVMNLVGRVLPWAMGLGNRGPHMEVVSRWVEGLGEVARGDDEGVGGWVRRRMAHRWLSAFVAPPVHPGPPNAEAEALRRAWTRLALTVVQGQKGRDEEAGVIATLRRQCVAGLVAAGVSGSGSGGTRDVGVVRGGEEMRRLLVELGARDPEAMAAGLLGVPEAGFRDKVKGYRWGEGRRKA